MGRYIHTPKDDTRIATRQMILEAGGAMGKDIIRFHAYPLIPTIIQICIIILILHIVGSIKFLLTYTDYYYQTIIIYNKLVRP